MTRALIYKLRVSGLWAWETGHGHTYVYESWRDAITAAMKEKT